MTYKQGRAQTLERGLNHPKRQILLFLFKKWPQTKTSYQIGKETQLPHATVHYAVKELERKKLIKQVAQEKWRTGLQAKKYGLTKLGASLCITLLESSEYDILIEKLDELAENWPDLHPGLKWWPIFKAHPLTKHFFICTIQLFNGFEFADYNIKDAEPIIIWGLTDIDSTTIWTWEDNFYKTLLYILIYPKGAEHTVDSKPYEHYYRYIPGLDSEEERILLQNKILELIRSNPHLHKQLVKFLEGFREFYVEELKDCIELLKYLKGL
jgi:hypothetical protein